MVQDHQKEIAEYRQEVNTTQYDALSITQDTLATLEEHLRKAQELQQKMSSGSQMR